MRRLSFELFAACVAVMLATVGARALDRWSGGETASLVYLLAVLGASYWLRFEMALLTAALSFGAINFFLVEPRLTLHVAHLSSWLALTAFFIVSVVVASLVRRLRRQTAQAETARRRAECGRQLAETLAAGGGDAGVLTQACGVLRQHLGRPVWMAVPNDAGAFDFMPDDVPDPVPDPRALRWCCESGRPLGPGTGNWEAHPLWMVPLGRMPGRQALLVAQPVHVQSLDEDVAALADLRTAADQLAGTYQRIENDRRARAAQALAERESMLNAFLAAVSHDMRTPLTGIVGAASLLREGDGALTAAERQALLDGISTEASYLASSTDNILTVVRLEVGARPDLDWESPEEIVGNILRRYRSRALSVRMRGEVDTGERLLRANTGLLERALSNLVDNALGTEGVREICVFARCEGEAVCLGVEDDGPGFPASFEVEHIQRFDRRATAGKGFGLGLAIVRAVAEAHRAQLLVHDREGGGACVSLLFPLEQPVEQGHE